MVQIIPQAFRVGGRCPITHAVFINGTFACYSMSLCGARKAVTVMRKRWLTLTLITTVAIHVGWVIWKRHDRRWR